MMTDELSAERDAADQAAGQPQTFEAMSLRPEVLRAVREMGFVVPMEVQQRTYAWLMEGRDVMVQSRTGSGKTAAFAIPFAQGLIDGASLHVQALCLCPTRELALQVGSECTRIGQYRGLRVVPVYGGAPMSKQIAALEAGAQVVAGTPGRVLDHLRRGTLKLDRLKVLVLDEADEMLSMGFYEEISEILRRCPTDRQTLLFSATIPDEIERIAQRHMRAPEKILLSRNAVAVEEITHAYYMVSGMARAKDLVRVLAVEKPESAIIFCNTREETTRVAEHLQRAGFDAEAISSDLTQKERERVMARTKAGGLHYLIATDIAARGIDINDLSHVINFTFPESAEVYIHRTGRTGRAGKSGIAVSLIAPRELGNFYYLKLTYKIRPEERMLPNVEVEAPSLATMPAIQTVEPARCDDPLGRLRRALGDDPVGEEWRELARAVASAPEGETLVARLLARQLGSKRPIRREPTRAAEPRRVEDPNSSRSAGQRRGRRRRVSDKEPRRGAFAGPPTIEPTEGREFWEAWVDQRTEGDARTTRPATPGDSARLYLGVGRRDGLGEPEIRRILDEKGIRAEGLDLRHSHVYLTVTERDAENVIGALNGMQVGGRSVVCERARR